MTDVLGVKEMSESEKVSILLRWITEADNYGDEISTQVFYGSEKPAVITQNNLQNSERHQTNTQLAVLMVELLNNEIFDQELVKGLFGEILKGNQEFSPHKAVEVLEEKQKGFLPLSSWQFAKVGLEVNPMSQRIAFKLHALQELLLLAVKPELKEEADKMDKIADLMTEQIWDKRDSMKILAQAIGPFRGSVHWLEFLPSGSNPEANAWLSEVTPSMPVNSIPEIALDIYTGESIVTPGTVIQILFKKTTRSQEDGEGEPKSPLQVVDAHFHENKIEAYLPITGPGYTAVQRKNGKLERYYPNPNLKMDIDLSKIGFYVNNNIPTIVYNQKEFTPENGTNVINVEISEGQYVQFVIINPGDIHDNINVSIAPGSFKVLAMACAKNPEVKLEGDFHEATGDMRTEFEGQTVLSAK